MMDIKIMDDRIIEQKPTPDPGKKHSKKLAGRSPKKRSRRKSDRYGKRSIFNKGKINRRPILSLLLGLGVLSAILLVTMLTASKTPKSLPKIYSNLQGSETESVATTPMPTGEEVLGVLTEVDPDTMKLTLYDVVHQVSLTYDYSGGTNITDKYGQQMSISQIPDGTMLEVFHKPGKLKLTDIRISTKAWEYVGVNNLSIDRSARVMKIASRKYRYTDDIIIFNEDERIPVTDLAEQDELTIWGYDQTIWSVMVTRGHGTVRLVDYDKFIGDFITIGYEAIQQIVKDMVITVREGNFNLTVENAKYTATKNITVKRNQETVVSLSDLGPDDAKVGRITFEISPFGADLYIDGELMSYASPIELDYGDHNIEVSLGGYTTYTGILKVASAGKTVHIDLPERSSKNTVTVSESNNNTGTKDTSDNQDSLNDDPDHTGEAEVSDDIDTPTNIDIGETENISNDDFDEDTDHKIYIQNPVGASVYLNGEYMGKSPGSFKKLIGKHVLTFIREGYETMSYTVEVKDDHLDTYFNMPDLVKKK
jgi:hypothetical protein